MYERGLPERVSKLVHPLFRSRFGQLFKTYKFVSFGAVKVWQNCAKAENSDKENMAMSPSRSEQSNEDENAVFESDSNEPGISYCKEVCLLIRVGFLRKHLILNALLCILCRDS